MKPRSAAAPSSRPAGFTLLECLAAIAVLAAGLLLLALGLDLVRKTERHTARRQAALQEAANLLTRATAVPTAELTAERAQALAAQSTFAQETPGGRAELQVTPLKEPAPAPPGLRLRAIITWSGPGDAREQVALERFYFALPKPAP